VSQIEAVPTGVYVEEFSEGDGKGFREEQDIPEYAFLMGHLGRLEPEKNLGFLSEAVSRFMEKNEKAHFVVIGNGTSRDEMAEHFEKKGLRDRLHLGGIMKGQQLVDAYHAMDVFVFASQSETQGMVLTEAMATGTPVVAVDAVGAREVVKDTENGRLLPEEDAEAFADALEWIQNRDDEEIEFIRKNCRQTAQKFSMENSVNRLIEIYEQAKEESAKDKPESDTSWHWAMDQLQTEWDLLKNAVKSAWYTFETPTEEMLETERQHGKKV
ncbi:MAG: glycosyltransferase family 4 protein, partial [Candidatus Sumerlaeota bacterium]